MSITCITSLHHDALTDEASARAPLERRFDLPDEAATHAFGARFAHALDALLCAASQESSPFAGLQVHLTGDLGAGKTTLVRATLRALGHTARVRSPTWTLVEPYHVVTARGELHLYHFDLYRFSDPAEWLDAGFRDYFGSGAVCLVEWPQRAGQLLGTPDIEFALQTGNGNGRSENPGRILTARAYSNQGKACLKKC